MVWKNQNSWGTGDQLQTTLISAGGEVGRLTPTHVSIASSNYSPRFFIPSFPPNQEMAMRKVTRTLFHEDDEDDDMVRPVRLPAFRTSTTYWAERLTVGYCVAPCRQLTAPAARTTSTT